MGSDISKGGLSLVSQIDRRNHARMLLGRSVKVFAEQNGVITEFIGRVVAVRNLHVAERGRSVHISFAEELEEQILSSLTRKA